MRNEAEWVTAGGKKECPGLDSLPCWLCAVSKQGKGGRGSRGMIRGRLVYRWRLVRSLVWGHGEQLSWSHLCFPFSLSDTLFFFLSFFWFSLSPPVPKKDTAKAKGRGGWGWDRRDKPEEETPFVDSITLHVHKCVGWSCKRLPSRAGGTSSVHSHGVSTILRRGWGLQNRQTTTAW